MSGSRRRSPPARALGSARRAILRRYRPQTLYPYPLSSLQPERLYYYLHTLWETRQVEGTVLEIGCWLGGTAALASRMLARVDYPKRYVAVDTFSGFVPDHVDHDVPSGLPEHVRHRFDRTSLEMVRRLLDHYGAGQVELVQGDIVAVSDDLLPERVAVCLVDVDLEIPVYESLRRTFGRLAPGGTILVDDCPEATSWVGARRGYQRFVAEAGLPERYEFGLGIVTV